MKFLLHILTSARSFSENSLTAIFKFKSLLHSHTISPKSNQTLKSYLKSSEPIKALLHFRHRFRQNPCFIDSFSVLFVLKASTQKPSSICGKQIHTLVIKLGLESIIQIQTSLVSCYSAAGNLADARQVFDETPEKKKKNVILWTALVSAYAENGKSKKAIELFRQMEIEKIELDEVIVTVALSACADLGALEVGERIYSHIQGKRGFTMDLSMRNALVNMYVKCGDIGKARKLFDRTKRKDVTTWTSMIVGHALNGQAEEALELFEIMKTKDQRTLIPNDVTFIGVLMACSHAGMVEEGKRQFRSMNEDYNLKPREAHYGCMVDMFCRAGLLNEAFDYITKMPVRPNAMIWRTLLGACSLHGNIKLGEEVQRKLSELDPDYVGDYVSLSNIYASKGMWDDKIAMRDRVMQRRVPGKSSIELGSIISEFVSGDDKHPMTGEICQVLKCLVASMASYGYSPECSCVLEYQFEMSPT